MAAGAPRQLDMLQVEVEAVYGTTVGSAWTDLPFEEFSVFPENEGFVQESAAGAAWGLWVDHRTQDVRGTLTMRVWPDNSTILHSMAGLPRSSREVLSYSFRYYNCALDQIFEISGARCDTARFTVSEGDPDLKISYDFVAQDCAVSNAADAEEGWGWSPPSGASFQLADMSFYWNVSSATSPQAGELEDRIEDLTIELRNNLRPGGKRNTSRNIARLDTGVMDVEVSGTLVLTAHGDMPGSDPSYQELVAARTTGATARTVVVRFDFPGAGTPVDEFAYFLQDVVLRTADPEGGVRDVATMSFAGVVEAQGTTAVTSAPMVYDSTP